MHTNEIYHYRIKDFGLGRSNLSSVLGTCTTDVVITPTLDAAMDT